MVNLYIKRHYYVSCWKSLHFICTSVSPTCIFDIQRARYTTKKTESQTYEY